jgi:hypothetical protein
VEDTIATVLPPADMYVETTSEFDIVKARLAGSQNQKADEDDNRPSLRRRSRPPDPDEDDNNAPSQDDDGHPTLKRRD